jgi:hypothetical protein
LECAECGHKDSLSRFRIEYLWWGIKEGFKRDKTDTEALLAAMDEKFGKGKDDTKALVAEMRRLKNIAPGSGEERPGEGEEQTREGAEVRPPG